MLVLSRRENEVIKLPGLDVTFTVLGVRQGRVQIGIDAPREIKITRPPGRAPEVLRQSVRRAAIRLQERTHAEPDLEAAGVETLSPV